MYSQKQVLRVPTHGHLSLMFLPNFAKAPKNIAHDSKIPYSCQSFCQLNRVEQ